MTRPAPTDGDPAVLPRRPDVTTPQLLRDDPHWYKDAIIYQLHVKAFNDSTNDGMGDFLGLTEKLDYIADLGVTAIWLLPFYPSPLRDDGYDIADYLSVHPSYGDLDQFKTLVAEAAISTQELELQRGAYVNVTLPPKQSTVLSIEPIKTAAPIAPKQLGHAYQQVGNNIQQVRHDLPDAFGVHGAQVDPEDLRAERPGELADLHQNVPG